MPEQTVREALVEQLVTEVGELLEPLESLFGPGSTHNLHSQLHTRVHTWVAVVVGDDEQNSAAMVEDLMTALWSRSDPPNYWWATPLGQAVARSIGHPSANTVASSVAGAMLGCSRQRVNVLVRAGRLRLGPEGGITAESVRARLREQELRKRSEEQTSNPE